jgi:tetratricopeptide (TPR) repeat protein
MSALNAPKKISKKQEYREDAVVTVYARAWDYADKNRGVIYGAIAGLVALVILLVGVVIWHGRQADQAQEHLGAIVTEFEAGNLREALDGTPDGRIGLLEIADRYGRTNAGNMARFYAGDALFRLGEYDQALQHFQDFRKGDNIIGASGYAGEASVYEQRGEHTRAAERFRRAADKYDNELTSPQYLLRAGQNYELAGDFRQARAQYEAIVERYPDTPAAANVDFYLARMDARQQGGAS